MSDSGLKRNLKFFHRKFAGGRTRFFRGNPQPSAEAQSNTPTPPPPSEDGQGSGGGPSESVTAENKSDWSFDMGDEAAFERLRTLEHMANESFEPNEKDGPEPVTTHFGEWSMEHPCKGVVSQQANAGGEDGFSGHVWINDETFMVGKMEYTPMICANTGCSIRFIEGSVVVDHELYDKDISRKYNLQQASTNSLEDMKRTGCFIEDPDWRSIILQGGALNPMDDPPKISNLTRKTTSECIVDGDGGQHQPLAAELAQTTPSPERTPSPTASTAGSKKP
ncbi:hypothetical protein BJ508DRAFT_333656 [Ascobolus immersus RN42]|uniref:Uncharacterized protein n=1 Tax=Ascobolus immersus RN42 TaxID=1160509 RepID=A0A3N4HKU9_ASCIM|nr:hypothetical protein BJ508DRAFT_333656 [Ascobolus immersus RN42]